MNMITKYNLKQSFKRFLRNIESIHKRDMCAKLHTYSVVKHKSI